MGGGRYACDMYMGYVCACMDVLTVDCIHVLVHESVLSHVFYMQGMCISGHACDVLGCICVQF